MYCGSDVVFKSGIIPGMKKGRRKIGECTYCGETAEMTNDHVIPKTLFPEPYPPNLIIVPPCEACNNVKKSGGDTTFRDYLALDLFGNQSTSGQAAFPKVLRANERGQSDMARTAALNSEMKPLFTSAGIYLGDFPTAKLEEGAIEDILATMVRGLYFYQQRERLPEDYKFDARRIHLWDVPKILARLSSPHQNGPYPYGEVFNYTFFQATEDRFTTIWLLWFFEKVCFTVATVQADVVLPKGRDLFSEAARR